MANDIVGNVKMSQICRVCLRDGEVLSPACESIIPKFEAPTIAVIELWHIFAEILTTQEAGFPDKLCLNCFQELQNTYLFMLKCEKADAILKQIKQIHFHLNNQCNELNNRNTSQTDIENDSMDQADNSDSLDCEVVHEEDSFIEIKDETSSDSTVLSEMIDEEEIPGRNNLSTKLNISKNDPCTNADVSGPDLGKTIKRTELNNERVVLNPAKPINYLNAAHQCPLCSYTCINSSNLHKHIFRRHVENIKDDDDKKETKQDAENHIFKRNSKSKENISEMSWDNNGDVMVGKFEVYLDMNKSRNTQGGSGRSKNTQPGLTANGIESKAGLEKGKDNTIYSWNDSGFEGSPLDYLLDEEFNINNSHNLEMAVKNICDPKPETDIAKLKGRDVLLSQTIKSENNDFVLTPLSSPMSTTELTKPEPIPPTTPEDVKPQGQTPHFVKYINRDGKVIKVWECGICSRNFQHQYTLMRHLPTHTNIRNFVCNECGKAFRQLSTLSQHRAIHSVERPYACETCNKSFNRISTLISHRKTHSEVKPFRCHMCQKGFHQKGNLRNHIYIHTNERPYRCPVCNKGFNQMSNLVCHSQKSHSNEFGSIWTCHRCNMSFSKRTLLRAHELETHHIQGTSVKSSRSRTANGRRKSSVSSSIDDSKSSESDGGCNEHCKSEISENGILIPAIDTEAMKNAKINKEMPFAVLHFFEGTPLLVRIVDYGNQSLLRPTKNEDFISLKSQQNGQPEKVCVPIVAAVYQTLNVAGRPEFKVMPPKNIYKFINQHQAISLNCDNNNEPKKVEPKPMVEIPASNLISLSPPQIPSDLRNVTDRLETPLFETLTNVKDEPSQIDENSGDFTISITTEKDVPRTAVGPEETNWWNKQNKMDTDDALNLFNETFQNIASGGPVIPKKLTETDVMPDQNASILDISQARNPLLSQGEPQISNIFNNDNLFNFNNTPLNGGTNDIGSMSSILYAFRNEGMDPSIIKSLFSEHPGLLDDINECLSEILP